ncbi:cysteine hydrolase [Motiliproteus coralliicola]|uniref:Cysteine hydrolase n=1 Tax=Motiliproteus coralliicola TaxID=2283196 RepID=A0A369WT63_9GAMM|nr:cysteine hydrolase [Motiliproteus coralliicola]
MELDHSSTALLITDPQNDFLREGGAAYELVKDNLKQLGTIDNIGSLFQAAKDVDLAVFVSPHWYFPHDDHWQYRGALQQTINDIGMFKRASVTDAGDLTNSGADFYEPYKKYIYDGKTVISSPHKVYGPDSNDLVLQLRKRGIQTVLIGGMAANLCTDSHMRELVENGFEVIMIKDAVGAPGEAAYQAALTNYGMIANSVISTADAIELIDP